MTSGSPWSERFVREDLADDEFRNEFVADQMRLRVAALIRALREQPDRAWSQKELGERMGGKPQSVVSRLEDPDYGKLSLQTLLEAAAAFKLPLWIDFPEWEDWLRLINDVPSSKTRRRGFDADVLCHKLNEHITPAFQSVQGSYWGINLLEQPVALRQNQNLLGAWLLGYQEKPPNRRTLSPINPAQSARKAWEIDALKQDSAQPAEILA